MLTTSLSGLLGIVLCLVVARRSFRRHESQWKRSFVQNCHVVDEWLQDQGEEHPWTDFLLKEPKEQAFQGPLHQQRKNTLFSLHVEGHSKHFLRKSRGKGTGRCNHYNQVRNSFNFGKLCTLVKTKNACSVIPANNAQNAK